MIHMDVALLPLLLMPFIADAKAEAEAEANKKCAYQMHIRTHHSLYDLRTIIEFALLSVCVRRYCTEAKRILFISNVSVFCLE